MDRIVNPGVQKDLGKGLRGTIAFQRHAMQDLQGESVQGFQCTGSEFGGGHHVLGILGGAVLRGLLLIQLPLQLLVLIGEHGLVPSFVLLHFTPMLKNVQLGARHIVFERARCGMHKAKLRRWILLLVEFSPPRIQPLAGVM